MPKNPLTKTEADKYLNIAFTLMQQAAKNRGDKITKKQYRENDYFGHYPGNYILGELGGHWQTFVDLFRQIDYTNLTRREQATLRNLLTKHIQNRATKAATCILANNYATAHTIIQSSLDRDTLRSIHHKQSKRYASRELLNLTKNMAVEDDPELDDEPVQPQTPRPEFPNLAVINPQVDAAVAKLQKLWLAAITIPDLSLENTYLLTETANTYLPDAWRMYGNLATLPDDIRQQASDMLLLQVAALTTRIKTITDSIGENALKTLRAHTVFITDKAVTTTHTVTI